MTLVAVIILGVGIVMLGSALDNSSIQDTLQKVLNNQPLNWSGNAQTAIPGNGTVS